MIRTIKAILFFMVLSGLPFIGHAQNNPECSSFPATPANFAELPPEEQRSYAAKLADYQICAYKKLRDAPQRTHSAGDAELYGSVIGFFTDYKKLMTTRENFPYEAFQTRFQQTQDRQFYADLLTYSNLASEIYVEDQCRAKLGTDDCTKSGAYAKLKEEGKDPRAVFEALGERLRMGKVPVWFVIGKVIIDDSARSDRAFELQQNLRQTKQAYDNAMETLELRKSQLAKAEENHSKKVAEYQEKPQVLKQQIDRIRAPHRPDAVEVRATQSHANWENRIIAADRRIEEIERAVKNLFENSTAEDTFSRDRIRALQTELEQVNTSRDQANAEIDNLLLPKLPAEVQQQVDDLTDELELEENTARRRTAFEDSRLGSAQNLWEDAKKDVARREGPYMAADAAMRNFRKEGDLAVKGVTSQDADIRLTGAVQLERIEELNRRVSNLESAQLRATILRKDARRKMLAAGAEADRANEYLLSAGNWSIAAQTMVEIADSAWSLHKATSGGPTTVFAETGRQILSNLMFPVSYNDAKGGKLEDYFKRRDAGADYGVSDTLAADKLGYSAFKTAAKQFLFAPTKAVMDLEKIQFLKAARDGAIEAAEKQVTEEIESTGFANVTKAFKPADDIIKKLAETEKKFADSTVRNGWKEFGKAQGLSFLKSLFKSAGKGAIKKEIADFMEQPFFDAYMKAQVDLSKTVENFRDAGDIYWELETKLTQARGLRDAALEAFDPTTGQFEDKNEPFFADPNYAFTLSLAEGNARDFDAEITLGGVALRRDSGSTTQRWVLPQASAERLTVDNPEKLDLVIKLK